MGIALRDQDGHLRRSEDLLADVADAFARIEDPAERVRLAFKLFDSEGVALVNLLRGGSGAPKEMRERARDLGIVLDEHLVRDAERARTELDTLAQVISANLTRAALEAAPVIADLSSWLADVAGKAGIAWERLFDAPEEKSLRTLRYELDLTEGVNGGEENASPWRSKDAAGGVMRRAPRGALVIWCSAGLRLAGVGPGRAPPVPALPETIAVAVHLEDVDVMGEAVEEGTGRALGAEHAGPLVEGQIAGDDDRAPLVALAGHLEQQLGTGW